MTTIALYPWRDAAAASLLGVLWHFTPPPRGHACRHLPFTLITLVYHDTAADGRTCRASSTPKSAASLSSTAFASAEKGGTSVTYNTQNSAACRMARHSAARQEGSDTLHDWADLFSTAFASTDKGGTSVTCTAHGMAHSTAHHSRHHSVCPALHLP
jgi:hypothetical protein